MTFNGRFARDYVGPILRSKQTRKNVLNSIFGCVGIVLIYWLLKIGISSLVLRTIFSVFLSVGIYGAILVLCKNKIAYNYLEKFKQRFQK
ncbi:hypothetical protein FP435_01030 [Lactobacillus sp. PV037]|uniref:hypothetical protein n=1 Tax=Lactobacillus sp. PV037 TaxID=2594496 RepID=UPI0022407418|nr:hypothetical protein [Lactobacillus sp. PV037]QNQ83121.1 hypothetical protein FP435_01030 [Lactobacillus sp. PV037]